MGVCSYCYSYQRGECFGWDQARGFCKITGPDDPKRLRNKVNHDTGKARDLRQEADTVERDAAQRVSALRAQADRLTRDCEKVSAKLATAE